jgi:hypothetical protein
MKGWATRPDNQRRQYRIRRNSHKTHNRCTLYSKQNRGVCERETARKSAIEQYSAQNKTGGECRRHPPPGVGGVCCRKPRMGFWCSRAWAPQQTGIQPVPRVLTCYHAARIGVNLISERSNGRADRVFHELCEPDRAANTAVAAPTGRPPCRLRQTPFRRDFCSGLTRGDVKQRKTGKHARVNREPQSALYWPVDGCGGRLVKNWLICPASWVKPAVTLRSCAWTTSATAFPVTGSSCA